MAVVTGGGNGIGRATVLRFLAEGARRRGRGPERGDRRARPSRWRERDGHGGRVRFVRTDVAEEAQVQAAIERAQAAFGRLDCVFNNAGVAGAIGPITHIEVEDWDFTMPCCVRGVFLGMKHGARVMKAQGGAARSSAPPRSRGSPAATARRRTRRRRRR